MTVRDQNRGAARTQSAELVDDPGGVRPGIDDDRFRRGVVGPHDVAIRLDWAELKPVHCKGHEAFESNGGPSQALKSCGDAKLEPARDRDAWRDALTGRAPVGRIGTRRADRARAWTG